MERPLREMAPRFSRPVRQIVTMLVIVLAVAALGYLGFGPLEAVFRENPYLNGVIFAVFALGVLICFLQVITLISSIRWIEDFASGRAGHELTTPPSLLAPLAALLRSRKARSQISSSSSGSILDSVATRMEESRDITRYLVNLLIFLGLLGTFYGLATTIPAVVETIRSLSPKEGESGMVVFERLMNGLEDQLGGMGTAFSSSLLGLAGSLVVGMLELFAGHGQNRFYRELEEWLSTITRVGVTEGEGGGADVGQVAGALDQMAAQMEVMQQLFADSATSRALVDNRLGTLADAVDRLTRRMEADAGALPVLRRMADAQARMLVLMEQPEEPAGAEARGVDAESRMRLRSIDVQLLRILEEISAGRTESIADLRGDIAAVAAAIRQAGRPVAPAPVRRD